MLSCLTYFIIAYVFPDLRAEITPVHSKTTSNLDFFMIFVFWCTPKMNPSCCCHRHGVLNIGHLNKGTQRCDISVSRDVSKRWFSAGSTFRDLFGQVLSAKRLHRPGRSVHGFQAALVPQHQTMAAILAHTGEGVVLPFLDCAAEATERKVCRGDQLRDPIPPAPSASCPFSTLKGGIGHLVFTGHTTDLAWHVHSVSVSSAQCVVTWSD